MTVDPVRLTRSLVDIDSTTGREGEAGRWLAGYLRERGYTVDEQPVSDGRFNVYAHLDAAPAIVNATILPVLFISNVFFQMDNAPDWLDAVSHVLPTRHFADAMLGFYGLGATAGAGVPWLEIGVIALWGVMGVVAAMRFFRWEPRR